MMASIVTRVGMMKRVTAAGAAFFAAAGLYSAPLVLAEEATESSATSTDYDAKGKPAEEGKRFLEDKKKEKGVITLPSGLMYKVLKEGKGTMHPEVIKGWTEAMQLMVEGDKWEMYIPSELAYGTSGSPPKIPGDSTLVFQMEIKQIQGAGTPANRCKAFSLEGCDDKQKKYIEKQRAKAPAEVQAEFDRATKMQDENAKTKNLSRKARMWLQVRLAILKQLVAGEETEKAEL
eukprot:g5710.t1